MIDINAAVPTVLSRLRKLPEDATLELLTFKRDRGVRITRIGDDLFSVVEFGYRNETVRADSKSLKKYLKTVVKREFPRSNKAHLREV